MGTWPWGAWGWSRYHNSFSFYVLISPKQTVQKKAHVHCINLVKKKKENTNQYLEISTIHILVDRFSELVIDLVHLMDFWWIYLSIYIYIGF